MAIKSEQGNLNFDDSVAEFDDYIKEPTFNPSDVLGKLALIEATGAQMVGAKRLDMFRFATSMHKRYMGVLTLKFDPSMTDEQLQLVQGKAATFAAASENASVAAPQKITTPSAPSRTDERKL